jgi:hypothetical protein
MNLTVELKIDINRNIQFKKVTKKSIQQNEVHVPEAHYYTNQINVYMHSLPLPLIAYELILATAPR